jgi:AraC-like DNA-binding protein
VKIMPEVCATFRFSTAGLPEPARAQAVRYLHERERTVLPAGFEPLEPLEPLSDRPPHVEVTKRTLPGLALVSGTFSGLRHAARPRGAAGHGENDLLFCVNVSGCSLAQQGDRELTLRDGDAFFATRSSAGFNIVRPTPARFIGCRVPRATVAALLGRLDDTPMTFVPEDTEALRLLVSYASAIADALPLRTPELQRLTVSHMQDLIAATIAATRGGRAVAEGRGIAAARLRAIMADTCAHLGDGDLSAANIARRHRVTPRYVHKLFESEGLTFSSFVLGQRLARAHRMLSDPSFANRSVSSVAFDAGFGDLSYFNRTFRRRYAATPTDIRQVAMQAVPRINEMLELVISPSNVTSANRTLPPLRPPPDGSGY